VCDFQKLFVVCVTAIRFEKMPVLKQPVIYDLLRLLLYPESPGMNALFRLFFFLLTAALTALPSVLFAQTVPEIHTHPVFQQIDNALQRGELSIDEAITEKFRYAYSERLDTSEEPIKCMAPTAMQFYSLKDQLSPETVRQVQQVSSCTPPDNSQNHLSPSGNFRLYYTTEGTHAVPDEDANQSGIPDYIERQLLPPTHPTDTRWKRPGLSIS
jgi:hypothetical protein